MDNIDDFMKALRTLHARLATLQNMEPVTMLLLDQPNHYLNMLDDAYAALGLVETKVDELGQMLEFEHDRVHKAIKQCGGEEMEKREG